MPAVMTPTRRPAAARQHVLDQLDWLIERQELYGYKPAWVGYKFLEETPNLAELQVCAKKLGYKSGWAYRKYQELNPNQ